MTRSGTLGRIFGIVLFGVLMGLRTELHSLWLRMLVAGSAGVVLVILARPRGSVLRYGGAIFIVLLVFVAWLLPGGTPTYSGGWSHQWRSGTIGRYEVSTGQDINALNSGICQWLAEHNFYRQPNAEAATALGVTNWNTPGILLSRYYNVDNRVLLFIPGYDDPLRNFQAVYFDLKLVGEDRDVRRRMADFNATREAFAKEFPSTWDPEQ